MIIEVKKIADLIPASYNPRKATKKQEDNLKKSLEKFGVVEPIVFNKQTGCIVGGHFRIRELKKLGYTEVECVIVDLPIEDEKELNIRLNANTGEWDWDLIETEWDTDTLIEWGLEIPEGDEPFGNETAEAKEDDFDTTPPEVAKTVIGDLYEIGKHRVLCGDSTDVAAVAKLMQGELADMVMTDPPYNVNYESGSHTKIENDNISNEEFYTFLLLFYTAFADVTKAGGAWYVWHADLESINFRKAFKDSGLLLKEILIWVKNALVMGRQDYHWKHEPCIYGWKEGAAHYFTDDRTKTTVIEDVIDIKKLKKDELVKILTEVMSDKTKTTVLHHDKPSRSDLHPTMKPILLLAPLIENSSKQGWLVADPFLGSGSTMVAAHQLKRKCYGMEISPQYTDVIVKRMLNLDSTLRVKRNGVDVTEEWRQEAVPIKLEATNK